MAQWPQPQEPPQQPPPAAVWPKLGAACAPCVAKTENCFCTFALAQSGHFGVSSSADELLEVRLALHADVLVDRHRRRSVDIRGVDASTPTRSRVASSPLEPIERPACRGPACGGGGRAHLDVDDHAGHGGLDRRRRSRRPRCITSSSSETARSIGSTSYLNALPRASPARDRQHLEQPSAWGTGANTEAKYLLLRHAFETLGARRVEFKTDAKNERARAALAAIPAEFEGIHRKHMLVRDGERRDSAWYAVIDDDWPHVGCARAAGSRPCALELARCPVSRCGTGAIEMIDSVNVIGRGRVGSAVAAPACASAASSCATAAPSWSSSASPTGRSPRSPPRSSPGRGSRTSAARPRSPRSTRTGGASPSTRSRPSRSTAGPEQLDGAWAAVTAETDEARALGRELATTLGLRPFDLADDAPVALPRGRFDRLELPRHALPLGLAPVRGRRRAAGGARPADDPHDRERLPADRADRAGRLGGGRRAHRARCTRPHPSSSRCTARLPF